ncbi:glycosyltransferase family 4 protein [Fluviibacterium sp. DFM31]|uniref:Glycosyltransferase family 4 protein n=1 Tax=Meridianimarinicoccus marinus TaxID=3231483 RepID=A0ABV3LAL1_9RHOB
MLAAVAAPLVALVHHPLALETGLAPEVAAALVARERDNLALARHILVPSPHTARVLMADYGVPEAKLTVVEPGVIRSAQTAVSKAEPPLILSVGLQAARKGHDVLLRALARLTDLDWQAVIVGRAHEAPVARALVQLRGDLGVTDRVRLAGLLSDDEVQDLYRAARVFALATRYEGYGMVFAEALVHGLPIVSCRVGAVPDTVPGQAGLLVEAEDDRAFAEALRRVLCEAGMRQAMASASDRAGLKLPDWDMQARRVGAVLEALTEGEVAVRRGIEPLFPG